MPSTPVYRLATATIPRSLRRHFTNETTPSIIVLEQAAGHAGLSRLMEVALGSRRQYHRQFHDAVIVLGQIDGPAIAATRAIFDEVATAGEFDFLAVSDLIAALKAQDAEARAVGAAFSQETGLLTFLTGDCERLVVPASAIAEHEAMGLPDHAAVSLIDEGHAVSFGMNYKVAFADLRLAHDPEYRAAVRQRTWQADRTFGGCLRRAREHRGLGQDQLGVADRSIRRIEAGIIGPDGIHAGTQKKIEKALRMTFEKIKEF
jgi:hypothetical protein